MCFELDSEPPIPRISGAAVSHDDLVLESEDGNRFAAFRALPDGEAATGVVILPGRPRPLPLLRGARAPLRRARPRGASPSTTSAAPPASRSGRTTGTTCRSSSSSRTEQVQADVGACVAHLRELGCDLDLHRRLLLRRQRLVGGGRVGPRPRRRGRLLRPAEPDDRARAAARGADPRAPGRGRPGHPARGQRRVRAGAAATPARTTS